MTHARRSPLRRVRSSLVAIATLAALALPAWGQDDLVIAQSVSVPGFDPHTHGTTSVEAVLVNIYDYLIMRDDTGAIQPALATSWTQLDETRWQFALRDDVTWHDGETFGAEDVAFTLERVANDESLFEHDSFRQITDVEIVDDLTVVIHTEGPDPVLLNRLSRKGAAILPKHVVDAIGWDGFTEAPIGTGPYRMAEWRRDDRVVLEAFDAHWRGAPGFDRVVFRYVPEDATRVGELIAGNVHIIDNVPPQDVARINGSDGALVAGQPTTRIMMLLFNTAADAATGDLRVRQAIDWAIDDALLIEAAMDGYGTPTLARVSPGVDAVPMTYYGTYNYDPERARALLAEAGYGPGELSITLQGPDGRYPKDAEQLEIIAVMLEQVGVNVTYESLEWSSFKSRVWDVNQVENVGLIGLANSMFDGWFALRTLPCDGSYAGKTNWCNAEFDQLMADAEFNLDLEERAAQLARAYEIVADELPMSGLFQLEGLVGVSTDVTWTPRPDEMIWAYDIAGAP